MLVLLATLPVLPAQAQSLQFPIQSPALRAMERHGEIRLGVPDDSPPFAWTGLDGRPIGYAVDVCRQVAAGAAAELGLVLHESEDKPLPHALVMRFVHIPAVELSQAVADGMVDLDCSLSPAVAPGLGSSPALAVSGTRLLVARNGPVSSWDHLADRTVAVVDGMRDVDAVARMAPGVRIRRVPSPGDGYALLATGGADAFAADDLVLAGLLATHTDGPAFEIVDAPVMQGPLVLRYPVGDPALGALVGRTVQAMRSDGALRANYMRWFTLPLPQGAALDRPPSPATDAVLGRPPG